LRPRKANRHLPPCVYHKHGRFWHVVKGKWHDLGTDLPGALAEYARRVELSVIKGGMADLIDRAFAVLSPKWATNTVRQNKLAAAVLKRKLAEFTPQQVKPKHCAGIKLSMAKTPNMANRVLSLLRQVFALAVDWQEVDSNPCVGLKRLPEGKRTRLLSIDEWQAIRDAAGPRLRAIMEVQYLTGQRISDVLGIRRSQLTDAGILFTQQKTGKRLVVRWSPELRAAVSSALALHRGVPALTLFIGRRGKPPDYRSVHLQWVNACAAAGVKDARPNDQRAQSLTAANRQGKNAQALAGHSSEAQTETYIRDREIPEVDGPSIRQVLDVGQKR
jgi:integrase